MFLSIQIPSIPPRPARMVIFGPDQQQLILGRQDHPTLPIIRLKDPSVARRHLRFSRDEAGAIQLADLGTAGGIYLDGSLHRDGPLLDDAHHLRIGILYLHTRLHRWRPPGELDDAFGPERSALLPDHDLQPFRLSLTARRDMGDLRAMLHKPSPPSFEQIFFLVRALLSTQPGALDYALHFASRNNFARGPLPILLQHFGEDQPWHLRLLDAPSPLQAIRAVLAPTELSTRDLEDATHSLLIAIDRQDLSPQQADRLLACALLQQLATA